MLGKAGRTRFGFGPEKRLTRSVEFVRLLRQGARRRANGYVFYFERNAQGVPRLGMLVTRRHSKRATVRNAIKRCVREAFRLEYQKLVTGDLLVSPPLDSKPGPTMINELRVLLERLNR